MINLSSYEEAELILEKFEISCAQEDLQTLQRVFKLFIENVSFECDSIESKEFAKLQHELAELEEENDTIKQELALQRAKLCLELKNEYKQENNLVEIREKLSLPEVVPVLQHEFVYKDYSNFLNSIEEKKNELEKLFEQLEKIEIFLDDLNDKKSMKFKKVETRFISYFNSVNKNSSH